MSIDRLARLAVPLLGAVVAISACGSEENVDAPTLPEGDETAQVDVTEPAATCDVIRSQRAEAVEQIETAYSSNAGLVALWEGERAGLPGADPLSEFAALDADQPVAVCVVSGIFDAPGGPPEAADERGGPYTRALFLVPEGASEPLLPIVFGTAENLSADDGPRPVDSVDTQ